VVFGAAAAAITFWPEMPSGPVDVAVHTTISRSGFRFSRRRIPPELTFRDHQVLLTTPALTALDLIRTHGGDPIDRVLRSRQTTHQMIWQAFTMTPSP